MDKLPQDPKRFFEQSIKQAQKAMNKAENLSERRDSGYGDINSCKDPTDGLPDKNQADRNEITRTLSGFLLEREGNQIARIDKAIRVILDKGDHAYIKEVLNAFLAKSRQKKRQSRL